MISAPIFFATPLDIRAYTLYNIRVPGSEVIWVSPRTGRPPKGADPRRYKINLRISESELKKIQDCADRLGGISRTDVIVQGVDLLIAELDKK